MLRWYDGHARELPWRSATASPWEVLVSEFMLQQTPVARVIPVYNAWVERWPTPAALSAESPGEAVRAWGRLGYPRRALRLHASAILITARHGGLVPSTLEELRALPGVGEYTAAAVASFAHRQRHPVLDGNVRRVLARVVHGRATPPASLHGSERDVAVALLPDEPETAARWSVAVMELGALVCTARSPACGACPITVHCSWFTAGRPAVVGATRRSQRYVGTDRQCRGQLLAVLRRTRDPVSHDALERAWPDAPQRERALAGLVSDGLAEPAAAGTYQLPGGSAC